MSDSQAEIDKLLARIDLYERLLADIKWASFGAGNEGWMADIEAVWLKKEIASMQAVIIKLKT